MLKLEKPPAAPAHGVHTSGTAGLYDFAHRHPQARGAIAAVGGIVTPTSYVRASYHAVHAFVVRNAADEVRYVRFTWEPVAGVEPRTPVQEATDPRPDSTLHDELSDRLRAFPQQMTLRMQIAEAGDVTSDATTGWPDARRRVTMGVLTLTHVLPDQAGAEQLGYNPTTLVDGVELSDDPLLEARRVAYEWSHADRNRRLVEEAGTMSASTSRLDRVLTRLEDRLTNALVPYWAWRQRRAIEEDARTGAPGHQAGGLDWTVPERVWSAAPSDNLQRAMNLVMPLKDTSVLGRLRLTVAIGSCNDELMAGLNNVGNVHFARFDLIDDSLCMVSVYDGDFKNYIRDFIVAIGSIFDVIMTFVVDPPPTPVAEHADEFIAWVDAHDLFQFPSSLMVLPGDLEELPRDALLLMNQHRHIMIGLYHCYPGFSTAQIRQALGVGW